MDHSDLPDGGRIPHRELDRVMNRGLAHGPITVSGARDDPEDALANLLSALQKLGLINDNTTAS